MLGRSAANEEGVNAAGEKAAQASVARASHGQRRTWYSVLSTEQVLGTSRFSTLIRHLRKVSLQCRDVVYCCEFSSSGYPFATWRPRMRLLPAAFASCWQLSGKTPFVKPRPSPRTWATSATTIAGPT